MVIRTRPSNQGSGIQPTFPGDSRLPPLIAIDHILVRNCTVNFTTNDEDSRLGSSGNRRDGDRPRSPASLKVSELSMATTAGD